MKQSSARTNLQKISLDKSIKLTNRLTKDTIQIQLKTDGEKITGGKFEGEIDILDFLSASYMHESKKNGLRFTYDHTLLYRIHIQYIVVNTIEKLMKNELTVPNRAIYLRTLVLELERIYSHLEIIINLGKHFSYPLLHSLASQSKEYISQIIVMLNETNNVFSYIKVGGVTKDLDDKGINSTLHLIMKIEKLIGKVYRKIKRSSIMKEALKETGFISRENAIKLSLSGPMARSVGITYDIRKSDPYASYSDLTFTVPVYDTCDLFGCVMVRLDEIFQSIHMIKQLLNRLPSGHIYNKPSDITLPSNNALTRVESPFGEMLVFSISTSGTLDDNPQTFKLTSPLKMNGQGLLARLSGEEIENIPLILAVFGNGWY